MVPQEQMHNVNNLDALQAGRYEAAVHSAELSARRVIAAGSVEHPYSPVTSVTNGFPYEYGVVSPECAFSLEAIGVDMEQVADSMATAQPNEVKEVATITIGDESMGISTYGQRGLQLRFSAEGKEDRAAKPELFAEKVKERFARSPGHRALRAIHEQVKDLDTLPPTMITEAFDPSEDLLGTAIFLQDIDALGYMTFDGTHKPSDLSADVLLGRVLQMPSYRGSVTETDEAYVASFGDKVKKQLTINKQTGQYQLSLTVDPAQHYLETPNQAPSAKSIPFVETECAKDLASQLDEVGLMFHPKLQFEMMSAGEADRYGNVYTEMSREVAKWVNNPSRTRLSRLFSPINEEYRGAALLDKTRYWGPTVESVSREYDDLAEDPEAMEALVRERWNLRSGAPSGEAAAVLMGLIDVVLHRPTEGELRSQLPVTSSQVEIRKGACFDVSSYYVSAAATNMVNKIDVNGIELLEKRMGSHTFMTTSVTQFNGVELPKGSLLSRYDDGWAFLRLTPFAFDSAVDQLAFGSEMAKTYQNEVESLQQIGGTTLSHLMGL